MIFKFYINWIIRQLQERVDHKQGVKTVSTQPCNFGQHPGKSLYIRREDVVWKGWWEERSSKIRRCVTTLIPTLKYSKYLEFFVLRKLDMYSTHSPPQKELVALDLCWLVPLVPRHSIWTLVVTATFPVGGADGFVNKRQQDILQELLKCF